MKLFEIFRKNLYIALCKINSYYKDTDEIPGFFVLLKNDICIVHEDIGVFMVTEMISQ